MTLGIFVFVTNHPSKPYEYIMQEELQHIDQYREWGPVFIPNYLIQWIGNGFSYDKIQYEIDAKRRAYGPGY